MTDLDADYAERGGVYWLGDDGEVYLVHRYQGGDYALADITAYFGLGEAARLTSPALAEVTEGLHLRSAELRELKVTADAQSFDFEPAFIEMCLEMYRFAFKRPESAHLFVSNF